MRVAVVIPVHGGAEWIERTLSSVTTAATDPPLIVIVDDGSLDDSIMKIKALQMSNIFFVRQANRGVAVARNVGFAALPASIEACLFLDQDDVLTKGALDILASSLMATRSNAVVGRARFIAADDQEISHQQLLNGRLEVSRGGLRPVPNDGDISFASLAYRNCINTPGQVLIRCDVLRGGVQFDPEVEPVDDWGLWLRLTALGQLATIPHTTISVRRHQVNRSKDSALMRNAEMLLRCKTMRDGTEDLASTMSQAYRLSERSYATVARRAIFSRERRGLTAMLRAIKVTLYFRLSATLGLRLRTFYVTTVASRSGRRK